MMPYMAVIPREDLRTIEIRNALRREANLSPLSVEDEVRRLVVARDEASFESYFKQNRHRFSHLWADRSRGFLTNLGIWNAVRKKLRDEMRERAI
jgi:hypothetical protein